MSRRGGRLASARRRAAGSVAVHDPATVGGLSLRYVASDVAAANGAVVSAWSPRTGSGTLSNVISGAQPTMQATALGGKPALRFDGSNDYLSATIGPPRVQPFTVTVAMKWNSVAARSQVLDFGSTQLLILPSQWDAWSGTDLQGGTPGTSPVVVTYVASGGNSRLLLNGTEVAFGNAGTQQIDGSLDVGRQAAATRYAAMDIGEVLIYTAALTPAQLVTVHSYCQDRYSIAVADYVAP